MLTFVSHTNKTYMIEIITAVGGIISPLIVAWFGYNQYRHNKVTDIKIERYKSDMERKEDRRSRNTANVFGELWKLLYELKADRVYVIQPHPLGHEAYISVQYEVTRKGIADIKPHIQSVEMRDCAVFCKTLIDQQFICFTDITTQIQDRVMRSILSANGGNTIAIRRLDGAHDWVGNIVVEICDESVVIDQEQAAKSLTEAAINIQFTIPEFRELKIR